MKKKWVSIALATVLSTALFAGCKKEYVNPELDVAFLGDSITAGAGAEGQSYCSVLEKEDYITSVQNVGFAGSTVGNSYAPFTTRYREINLEAEVIFVFGGTNDYGSSANVGVPLGQKGDTTVDTFYGALDVLIKALQTRHKDADLYFMTPIQRDDAKWGYPTTTPVNKEGNTLEDYRDAVVEMCDSYSLKYIDLYNVEGLRLEDEGYKEILTDGLHPNADGHKLIAEQVDKFLRKEYKWPKQK